MIKKKDCEHEDLESSKNIGWGKRETESRGL